MKVDVVRAWKDATYRAGLSADQVAFLPSNPAGLVDLTDEELKAASGLASVASTTCICCTDTNRPRHCCP